jgi:hypothetical protein
MLAAQTQPAPAPGPLPIQKDLYPDVYVATCDVNQGSSTCYENGQTWSPGVWRMPSVDRENGYRICSYEGQPNKDPGDGKCLDWLPALPLATARTTISAKCTSHAKTDNPWAGGGHAYWELTHVKLVLQPYLDKEPCVATQDTPPPTDAGESTKVLRCENGYLLCQKFRNGMSEGQPFNCPSPPFDNSVCTESLKAPRTTKK